MPRAKKVHYEWVESLRQYRKRIKDADGKYFALYGPTEEILAAKEQEARAEIELIVEQRGRPTVRQYSVLWLRLAEGGTPDSKNALKNHILPVIGDLCLADVTPDDAKSVLSRMTGKSHSLRHKVLFTMRGLFDAAVDNGYCKRNPCARLKAGGEKAKEKEPLTAAQKDALLAAVTGTVAETFCRVGLYTGLRREEILGLRWDCVHLDDKAPHVSVRRALRWPTGSAPVVSSKLKADASRRDIPIPPQLVDYLRPLAGKSNQYVVGTESLTKNQFRKLWDVVDRRQAGERTYRDPDTGEKMTFIAELGAKSRGGNFCYTLDFPVTPHILRHTYITDLFLAGTDIKTVQYLAGHSDPEITLRIYIHLMQHRPEDLIAVIRRTFAPQLADGETADAEDDAVDWDD